MCFASPVQLLKFLFSFYCRMIFSFPKHFNWDVSLHRTTDLCAYVCSYLLCIVVNAWLTITRFIQWLHKWSSTPFAPASFMGLLPYPQMALDFPELQLELSHSNHFSYFRNAIGSILLRNFTDYGALYLLRPHSTQKYTIAVLCKSRTPSHFIRGTWWFCFHSQRQHKIPKADRKPCCVR